MSVSIPHESFWGNLSPRITPRAAAKNGS